MFGGHFGVAYAFKRAEPRASLGLLFLATHFMDVIWAVLVLLGIEKGHVANIPSSPLELTYMPFTHSLTGSLFWSAVVYIACRFIPALRGTRPATVALVMGAGVFSHWVLDLLVHRPDLGLIGDSDKVGFGLYNYPAVAFSLEALVLLGGFALYLRGTTATTFLGKYGMYLFVAFLLGMTAVTYWGPPPPSVQFAAAFNEIFYWATAAVAVWLDSKRRPRQAAAGTASDRVREVVAQRRPAAAN